jgi:hypothetical protein
LRSGNQITMPQFQQFQGSQIAPAPIAQSVQNAYGQQLAGYNAGQASDASFNSGLMSLAGAALPFVFSDRRLKSNIKRIGTHRLGIGIYSYTIFGAPEIGVLADEVLKVRPEAVAANHSDYLMVNYGALS